MPNSFTKTTFSTTYKDDFKDSDHYHRILFNTGKALQARELTQMQTITQKELERLGRHIFKEGSVVLPGGLTIDNRFEYVKLATTDTTGFAVGDTLTGGTSGVQAKLLRIEPDEGSDPATFYIKYINTSSGTSSDKSIRFSPNESLSNGSVSITSQSTNTDANPAVGRGTRAAIDGGGTFFVKGHFVTCDKEEILVSKYTSNPNEVIGFKVTEDIITADDTNALYDNQNATPNLTAPGADRYRIRLSLTLESLLSAGDGFFVYNRLIGGEVAQEVDETTYNIVERELATRIKEESGDYVVEGFASYLNDGDSDSVLELEVSRGIAYVDGYRVSRTKNPKIVFNKSRTTEEIENEAIAANYGNYVVVSATASQGFIPNVNVFQSVNFRASTDFTGTSRGRAHVRAVAKDGANYRIYLFNVQMDAGYKFSDMRSIGRNANEYFPLVLEGGVAVIKEAVNNNLFFHLDKTRPQDVHDVSFAVQRRVTGTTNSSGVLDVSGSLGTDETYTDQTSWIVALDSSSHQVLPSATASGNQVTTGRGQADDIEVLAFVNLGSPTLRTKTLDSATEAVSVINLSDGRNVLKLSNPDIVGVTSVINAATSEQVKDRFDLDDGQRDNAYYNGFLTWNGADSTLSGTYHVTYSHYTHGVGDYFSVNSYNHLSGGVPRTSTTKFAGGGTKYSEIPQHRQRNGEFIDLRDVLDFRPIHDSAGNTSNFTASNVNELPENTASITADVIYYQARKDILTVTANRDVAYITGDPALDNPLTPLTPNDALKIKEFSLAPFTDDKNDVEETFVQNRRFTMRDISGIVDRIDNLEEITTLNLLEVQTATIEVLDSSGANRFKNGLFADNFSTFDFSDVEDSNYRASFNLPEATLSTSISQKAVPLAYDSDNVATNNTKLTQNFVTLDYSETPLISQTLASETENINPFEVFTFIGNMVLEPTADIWRTTRTISRRINRAVFAREFARLSDQVRSGEIPGEFRQTGRNRPVQQISSNTSGRRVSIQPFMRSRLVRFKAEALRPNTRHFLFFDGEPISAYAKEISENEFVPFSRRLGEAFVNNTNTSHPEGSENLISDALGNIFGSFLVPNNDTLRFRSGEREVKLLDINTDNNEAANSSAFANYFAEGTIQTNFNITTVISLRPAPRDPLAQSFNVQNSTGAFLTGIDVYFASRAGGVDSGIPVRLEVRPLRNGVPSQDEVVPGSQVVKPSAEVALPADLDDLTSIQAAPTRFTFDAPIYVPGNTPHAFVLMADTKEYNVYVAKAGDLIIGTDDQQITEQPSLGSLFLSQNAQTWTPDQTRDMMFQIHRASFVSNGTAILENMDMPQSPLPAQPFRTSGGSSTVTVFAPGHGLGVNDTFSMTGVDSTGNFGGIVGTNLQGSRTVTKVDARSFTFTAGDSATSTITVGNADQSQIFLDDNAQMDNMLPQFNTFIPADQASVTFRGSFAEGRSFASPTNTYAISGTRSINPFELIRFESPKVIAHRDIEDAEATLLSAGTPRRSASITANLSTSSNFVSPVLLMNSFGIIAENNLIDNQDSDASVVSPLNNPIEFVNETNASNGSHASKHIARPVTLEQPAVGLKVLIGANRPNLANFDLYYRTLEAGSEESIAEQPYILAEQETIVQTDENRSIFREYEYTIGGLGGDLNPFTTFQLKIVMRSSNSSKIPTFRDIRAIALGT